jgi:hypothetical protein
MRPLAGIDALLVDLDGTQPDAVIDSLASLPGLLRPQSP